MAIRDFPICIRDLSGDSEHRISFPLGEFRSAWDYIFFLNFINHQYYLNEQQRQQPRIQTQFSAPNEGITFTPEVNYLVPANYNPIVEFVVESFN